MTIVEKDFVRRLKELLSQYEDDAFVIEDIGKWNKLTARVAEGVYVIRCTENGKAYVGQSANVPVRIMQHLASLENHKHSNKYLQEDFDKYGSDGFVWAYLGTDQREEWYYTVKFGAYTEDNGYNFLANANDGSVNMFDYRKRTVSESDIESKIERRKA